MSKESLLELGKVAAALGAFAVLATFLAKMIRKAVIGVRKVSTFLEDWNGETARPGVPGRLGVMTRLERLEKHSEVMVSQVQPNGGASMRDTVDKIADVVGVNDDQKDKK